MRIIEVLLTLLTGVVTTIVLYYVLSPPVFTILNYMAVIGAPSGVIESVKTNYLLVCILFGAAAMLMGVMYAVQVEYDRYYRY